MPHPSRRSVLVANPSADAYGSDRMMTEAVRGLLDHGWDVVVTASVDGPLRTAVEEAGARFVVCPAPVVRKSHLSVRGLAELAGDVVRGVPPMVRLIRSTRPDVLYVNTVSIPGWLVLSRVLRVPAVQHVHEAETAVNPVARLGLELPLRLAHRVVFNSETSRAATRLGRGRAARGARVVYNGVAPPPTVTPPRSEVGEPRLTYVGRLSPRKGVDVAVDAVAELARRGTAATLQVVGDTFPGYEWYEAELRDRVTRAGLGSAVSFTGFVPSVWPVLDESDILLVPSRGEESFGNVVVEAGEAARPVVASDHSGLREAMDGVAVAVPVAADDPGAVADAVTGLLATWPDVVRRVTEGAERTARRFAPSRYHFEIASVLDELVDPAHPSSTPQPAVRSVERQPR